MLPFLLCFLWPTLGLIGIGILHQVPDSGFYDQITVQDIVLGALGGFATFVIGMVRWYHTSDSNVIYKRKF